MKQKVWQKQADCYFMGDTSSNSEELEPKIYTLEITPKGQLYLKLLSDKFSFDFKIYGLETGFIERVVKTYKNTTGNLGVLCNGVKGTGKTITAEIIANNLNVPVLIIHSAYEGISGFLAEIHQDIVVLIDEYEKVFAGGISEDDHNYDPNAGNSTLLSVMDGVYKTKYRKTFLLTTNRLWINENLLNRPGRLRYMKTFGDLTMAQITEIVDDCLVHKKYKKLILDFMKPLKIITVDIVKSIVSEVNIFNEEPVVCCKDFNVQFKEDEYQLIKINPKGKVKEEILESNIRLANVSRIMTPPWKNKYFSLDDQYYLVAPPDYKTLTFKVSNHNYTNDKNAYTVKLKKMAATHYSYMGM